MAFKDLDEFLAPPALELPIGGKVYKVEDVDAETGMLCQRILRAAAEHANGKDDDFQGFDDDEEIDFYQRLLGNTYQEMQADGVSWSRLKHAAITAMVWVGGDDKAAQQYWESGGNPEALSPATGTQGNRGSRRASAAAARTTKAPASGSGTRARKASPVTASRGAKSSSSGPTSRPTSKRSTGST